MISSTFSLINVIGWALIHFIWQGALIGVVTALLMWALRNARPQSRYLIACCALLLCAILPMIAILKNIDTSQAYLQNTVMNASTQSAANEQDAVMQTRLWLQANMQWIVLWWSLVVTLLSLRLGMGLLWLRGYYEGKRGIENHFWQNKLDHISQQFGIHKRVLLRVVDDIESPVTIGFFRPMVLIPASLITGMPTELLEALIAHEVAHISRFDYAINLLQNLIEMLLFFHPAVWWISKKIRIERENIADDLAARNLGEPRRLALALQELDKFQLLTPQLAQAAHGGNLMFRIKRLIRPEVKSSYWKTAVIIILAVFVIWLIAVAKVAMTFYNPFNLSDPIDSKSISQTKLAKEVAKDVVIANPDGVVVARIDFAKAGCRPEYPRVSLRNEETGMTTLAVVTGVDGKVSKVDILESSGYRGLDSAVKDQLLSGNCINKPGTLNGEPIATTTKVQYKWVLD
jgi:bla regulator protein BlaR1